MYYILANFKNKKISSLENYQIILVLKLKKQRKFEFDQFKKKLVCK